MSSTISLSPDQVEQHLAQTGVVCRFSAQERAAFATTPVVSEPRKFFAFPTPAENSSLTLSTLRLCVGIDARHQPSFFDHSWYQGEAFMETRCPAGWHFLSMDVLPNSIQQPLDYSRSLETHLVLPLAVEVVLMLFLHYAASREQLLQKKHTWCSDTASQHRHVTVGAFGRSGVFLSSHPSNFASRGLGISPKVVGYSNRIEM